jgi:hypothetical protein
MMAYLLVRWLHDFADDPILLFSELGGDRYETRKVGIFRGGRVGLAGAGLEVGGGGLGVVAVPAVSEIATSPESVAQEPSADEFEAVWRIALQVTGAAP